MWSRDGLLYAPIMNFLNHSEFSLLNKFDKSLSRTADFIKQVMVMGVRGEGLILI